jgi:AsmA protein
MGRLLKILLIVVAGLVGIVVIAAIALIVFFDPNDYRDEIAVEVKQATGRDLTIEGDLGLSVFPWLAVEVGRSTLGNAEGFGESPFATFEEARLSVRLAPLLFRQEVTVGTASLDSLVLNLQVAEDGTTNWQDLAEAGAAEPAPAEEGGGPAALDIANVNVRNAEISYQDARAGSAYLVSNLSLETGRIAGGVPFDVNGEFDFEAQPGELRGHVTIDGTTTIGSEFDALTLEDFEVAATVDGVAQETAEMGFAAERVEIDTAAETIAAGRMGLEVLGVRMRADIAPFSYAGTPELQAQLTVEPFSLKEVMQALGTEPPVTSDPDALTRVAFNADAAVGETAIVLRSLSLELDDTTLTGQLSVPTAEEGLLEFELAADSINLDAYMAPGEAGDDAAAAEGGPIEIPVELIRAFEARGRATLGRAMLAGMVFENVEVGLDSRNGNLRLHPLGAELFEGTYEGDVRIDASGETPAISVDEKVTGVSLTPLVRSMFDQENVSGTIAGSFQLRGSGKDLDEIRSDLDGNMAFQLADGAWEGTDIWHQLRTARALFRGEQPPEARSPPRTEFTSVVATGTVTDGVFSNDDLLAELPFLQLTGNGTVDLVQAEVDYSLQARVLEKPEFVDAASQAELEDFTEAVIPLQITGQLASPRVRPDIDGMLKAEVEKAVEEKREELEKRVLDRLFGGDEDAEEQDDEEEERDLKDRLRSIFDR